MKPRLTLKSFGELSIEKLVPVVLRPLPASAGEGSAQTVASSCRVPSAAQNHPGMSASRHPPFTEAKNIEATK
jgi:hypothetical protein